MNLSWLVGLEEGYSRAVPLQMIAAFPEKAVEAEEKKCKDWEAGIAGLKWLREQLDAANRKQQVVLALVDGGFERVVAFWRQLPERTAGSEAGGGSKVLTTLNSNGLRKAAIGGNLPSYLCLRRKMKTTGLGDGFAQTG